MAVSAKKTGDPVYDTFIKRSLGTILPECIRQLTECQPVDPIEFISNALYKAVDSYLYKKEKEKYLNECLKESQELQKERDARKARLDEIMETQNKQKELLRQAREDEIKALQNLAENAELYGIELSPKSKRRMDLLKQEAESEQKVQKPIAIMMPRIKIGPDGKPIVIRKGDGSGETPKSKKSKSKGRWVEVEEQVTTDSGTVITVKKRKWQSSDDGSRRGSKNKEGVSYGKDGLPIQRDYGSVFGDDPRFSGDSQRGIVSMTNKGHFAYHGGSMGSVEPPDPLDKQLAPADNPDIWAKERFDCHTLYDHELYINCDAQQVTAGDIDKNQHHSPPRKNIREYLESISRTGSSEEEGPKIQEVEPKRSLLVHSEGEEYRTDIE